MTLATMNDSSGQVGCVSIPPKGATPDPDAAIVAAEAEVARLYALWENQPDGTQEEKAAREETWKRAWQVEDFIAAARPTTPAGAAVKLRRLLDAEVGVPTGPRDQDFTSMSQILEYLYELAGKPTHPTRRVWTPDEDGADQEAADEA